ncbi:MAG TPA: cytochrome C oxidase subunit IV family protein [Methylomirabilota bacterium]|jgi:cytochrome c oxidase subunit 4|nr:cytochrome C oxidase subunit IV family protein [Methylomirabilota bacterium]
MTEPLQATQHEHASIGTYVRVAVILCIVTALEFTVIYIRRLTPILLPLLLVLSAGKFALVVMFYMHLRYDAKPLTFFFVSALLLASGIALALMTLTGDFLVFKR